MAVNKINKTNKAAAERQRIRLIKSNVKKTIRSKATKLFSKINKVAKNKKQKFIKKPRKRITRRQLLSKVRQIKDSGKPAPLQLNVDFYRAVDGVYTSYWVGKFANTLLRDGERKTVTKQLYEAFGIIKFSIRSNPLILFLEILDKIKPILRLRNYIVRRVIIKEYPIAVLRPRQLILAVHWLKEDIRSGSGQPTSFSNTVANKLLDFRANPKKNNLIKKRNEFTKRTIKAQFNVRYHFR